MQGFDSFRRIDLARFDDPLRQFFEVDLTLMFRPSFRAANGDAREADLQASRSRFVLLRRTDRQLLRSGERLLHPRRTQ